MAQKDRSLTFGELLEGKCSQAYLDKKEQIAIVKRHIGKLANERFDIEDKMMMVGEKDYLVEKKNTLTIKIDKLKNELAQLEQEIKGMK